MYSVWVTLQVIAERETHFREAIAANAAASITDEPGCLSFDVIELDPEKLVFAFYERYASPEAFHEAHRQTPHYCEWRKAVETDVVPGSQVVTTGNLWLQK
ncbi:hypothetical protein GCM10010974_27420 [Brevibacterium sediminis]|uniref:ABM domain-containing protein n=1 Tax=Brevibacterium sediminis TaxID=1857024 RepID=A0ABQ1MRB3_9MICO|nr:antibiotic biosynthesis monooxygenase [Brevibacterium sediminis]GGC43566.1 hypothetical protein GCM10010974_27420 [Brevibacterium sediminis]